MESVLTRFCLWGKRFETIGLFAAGVVAANMAKVPNHQLNQLTAGYLISRAVFNL